MTMTDTPTDSGGTGLTDAQAKIAGMLDAEDGDTQTGEQDPALQDEPEGESDDNLEIETESEGEDSEESEEVESDEQEDESDEDESPEPETIDIDGTPVPVEELKKGYLRQQDYTRKTMALAEERKALEGEAQSVQVERAQYAQLLPVLAQQLQAGFEKEPDWDTLFAQDPIGAVQIERAWRVKQQQRQEYLQAISAEQERLQEQEQVENQRRIARELAENQTKLLEAIPSWRKPEVAKAEKAKVREYAKKLGFTDDELKFVTDARAVVGLYKAMKYDELAARRDKVVQAPKPQVAPMRPGGKPGKVDLRGKPVVQAKQRLAKTGNVRDAASAIEFLL